MPAATASCRAVTIENTASLRRGLRPVHVVRPPNTSFFIENTASLRRGLRLGGAGESGLLRL